MDGLSRDVFDRMVAAHELPHIEELFVRGGVGVEQAVASLPTTTYPNIVSILTGCFPGHHGILGNQWFDRATLRFKDYTSVATYTDVNHDFCAPTIYELLDPEFTVSILNHTRRGASEHLDSRMASGIDWCLHRFNSVDRRVAARFSRVVLLARLRRRWPIITTFYFPGLDEIGHHFGPDSAKYAHALRVIDEAVGAVRERIQAEDMAGSAYWVLATDHGFVSHREGRFVNLVEWLEKRLGWRVWQHRHLSEKPQTRRGQLDPYDAVVVNGAHRRLSIYLRGDHGWSDRRVTERIRQLLPSSPDPLQSSAGLLSIPGVGLVCVTVTSNRVQVYSRRGISVIERRVQENEDTYRLIQPDQDGSNVTGGAGGPLEYLSSPALADFVKAGWHTSREWLSATASSEYPDFVPQIVEMFDSLRAGDVVVFAAADWSFARIRGGHGSCLAKDMHVPLYFTGPDLPHGAVINSMRTVDVLPTILELLGKLDGLTPAVSVDGISMANQLRGVPSLSP